MNPETRLSYSKLATQLLFIMGRLLHGCGNHGCRVEAPLGMATNGACHCSPRDFATELRDMANLLDPQDDPERPREQRDALRGKCGMMLTGLQGAAAALEDIYLGRTTANVTSAALKALNDVRACLARVKGGAS